MLDPRLLDHYQRELLHLREGAAEFASEHPQVAARLALQAAHTQGECPDPFVERLLEGFAFVAARLQLRLDGAHAAFTQQLLEALYPGLQAPVPSMAVVQVLPDAHDAALAAGPLLPRGSLMQARPVPGQRTACRFATAHALRLWPLRVAEAACQGHLGGLPAAARAGAPQARACLRLRLETTAALPMRRLALDELVLFLAGDARVAHRVYELLTARCAGVALHDGRGGALVSLGPDALLPAGLDDDEALLPRPPRVFGGYRLLREYAAMPERFLFVRVRGLRAALARVDGSAAELLVLLHEGDAELEQALDASHFALHCTPVANLFPHRTDRVEVAPQAHEHPVVADRTRPLDFEVVALERVTGHGRGAQAAVRRYEPAYGGAPDTPGAHGHYTLRRVPRVPSAAQRRDGPRSGYVGTELFLALSDPLAPPGWVPAQLSVQALCSNRDLPLLLAPRGEAGDFTLEDAAPVAGVRCLRPPTRPAAPALEGEAPWRLASHLALNHLSLLDADPRQGAAALRELLGLHALDAHSPLQRQLQGLVSVRARSAVRRVPLPGPIAFGRGAHIDLCCDEGAFEGGSALLLGTVLERLLARHASLNSFTQLALHSTTRGEIRQWPPRLGTRAAV